MFMLIMRTIRQSEYLAETCSTLSNSCTVGGRSSSGKYSVKIKQCERVNITLVPTVQYYSRTSHSFSRAGPAHYSDFYFLVLKAGFRKHEASKLADRLLLCKIIRKKILAELF
jgi:hypothetical protein